MLDGVAYYYYYSYSQQMHHQHVNTSRNHNRLFQLLFRAPTGNEGTRRRRSYQNSPTSVTTAVAASPSSSRSTENKRSSVSEVTHHAPTRRVSKSKGVPLGQRRRKERKPYNTSTRQEQGGV